MTTSTLLFPGFATTESTQKSSTFETVFASRRRELYPFGPLVAPVGFGSYRIGMHPQLGYPECEVALEEALLQGVNLIDTSTNYGDGQSELLIGKTLTRLFEQKKLKREQVVLVTKVGYIQGSNLSLAKARELEGRPFPEVTKFGDDLWHCFSPEFIRDQVERSRARLHVETLDVLLIHNPEYLLKAYDVNGVPVEKARESFYREMARAFACLEQLVHENVIRAYGVSSNTLGFPEDDPTAVFLPRLKSIADNVTKDSHFKVVQFPLNWLEVTPLFWTLEGSQQGTVDFAAQAGIGILLNRPLNAMSEGGLIRLSRPQISEQEKAKLSEADRQGLANWQQLAGDLEKLAKEFIIAPGFDDAPLSQLVLSTLMWIPGVSSVLLGMRKQKYVKDAEAAVALPKILGAKQVLSRIYENLEFTKTES